MSLQEDTLPPRDPETLLPSPLARVLAFFAIGLMGGAFGAVLMAADQGIEGHGHGGGGNAFAMVPHQLLLTLPLALLLVLLLRESRTRPLLAAIAMALAGVVAVDALLTL